MNAIKAKLTNLVTVSRRDSAIFTTLNNSHISLFNFVDKNKLKQFFNNKEDSIEISFELNIDKVNNWLKTSETYDEFLSILNKNQIYINKTRRELLKQNFYDENFRNKIIDDCIKSLKNYKNTFKTILKTANYIKKEKSTWNLFLCRYFLIGKTPIKKQLLNAPLILYKVNLNFDSNKIIISKFDDYLTVNEKLFVFLQKELGKQNKELSEIFETNDIEKIKKDIEINIGTNVNFSDKGKMDFDIEISDENNEYYNNLNIEDRVCFGIFDPNGGKLKEDLERLIANNSTNEIFEKIPKFNIEKIEEMESVYEPIIQISNLNIYQKYAVRSSLLENTIIQGPPGTGKSEVITNIIANIIFQKKDAIIVSEKSTALDVIWNRLGPLNAYSLLIYNDEKDKFYESIINLKTLIGNTWLNQKVDNSEKIKNLSDNLFLSFEEWIKLKKVTNKYKNFATHTHDGLSFFDLIRLIDKLGGNDIINEIQNQNFVAIANDIIVKNDIDKKEFFKHLNDLTSYINKYKIENEQEFNILCKESLVLKNILEKYNVHISKNFIENIKNCSIKLSNYLIGKSEYQDILRINPYIFFDDIINFKKFHQNTEFVFQDDFFNNLNKSIPRAKRLMSILNSAKEKDKKYIIDKFLESYEIIDKKPISKFFYSSKLSPNDKKIIKNLEILNSIEFSKYSDFDFIYKNSDIFNPLSVVYFFNENIFDDKYIQFIKNKFYMFSYNMYLLNNKYAITEQKFDEFSKVINAKDDFINNYPEFINKNLFQSLIDSIKKDKWAEILEIVNKIHKLTLISNLSILSRDDKEYIEKSIRLAMSKKKPPIFAYIQKYGLALQHLFPIWIGRPEQMATFIPLKKDFFSYGIFDEASQMFLERAYPLLYRCKTKIIAGDDKQLKPSNFFVSRDEDDNVEFEMFDDLDNQDSLLDRATSSSWNEQLLQNHYRSEYQELIKFSAENIYNGKLNYASKNSQQKNKALEVHDINGNFEDSKNIKEAQKILELIDENINKYKTILVITFNSKQSLYINSLIQKTKFKNDSVIDKYNNGLLEIINIENVQGNEADLVIISVTYGKKENEENLRSNFGPLIQKNGLNRLNVAITRSKKKMIVVKSFKYHEVKNSENENLLIFRKFIQFLDEYKQDESKMFNKYNNNKFKNIFQETVFNSLNNKLLELGLVPVRNYDVGNKTIDIAIMDKDKVIIGIKFTKLNENFDEYRLDKEIDDQLFLESKGYKIFRIFEHEWLIDYKNVLQKFYDSLKVVWNLNK